MICLVSLLMARPGTKPELVRRWSWQKDNDLDLEPPPNGHLRTWVGQPESKDWDRLQAFKERDGWSTVHHGRKFVAEDNKESDVQDKVSFTGG